jgi:hypothetical protein
MRRSEKRRGTRIQTRFKTLYSADGDKGGPGGPGILAEISYSGARLTDTSSRPERGTRVCIYVWLPNQPEPFELAGHVVRHTPDGFAIEYEKPGQDTCHLVDAAAALVTDENAATEREVQRKATMPDLHLIDLSQYSAIQLQDHAVRVEQMIARKREETRNRVRDEMVQLAEREGLTPEEVLSRRERG